MKELNCNSVVPLYKQISQQIRSDIFEEKYQAGEKISSEEELMKIYKVSRITVRNALAELVKEKILVKKRGKGTFVAALKYVESMSAGGSFTRSCKQMNAVPSTKVIAIIKKDATPEKVALLNLAEGEKLIEVRRLRYIDQFPAMYEIDYFPESFDFIFQIDLEKQPLLESLHQHLELQAAYVEDVMEVTYAEREKADYLHCRTGMALLGVFQTVKTREGKVLYYNEQYIRSDRYKYAIRSTLGRSEG